MEIALYLRIETLATAVGDSDTAKLAKGIRRDEERMAKYLTAELPRLVKDVVRAEIPRDQRATNSRSRRRTTAPRPRKASPRTRTTAAPRTRTTAARAPGPPHRAPAPRAAGRPPEPPPQLISPRRIASATAAPRSLTPSSSHRVRSP